ncbi:MAG: hypothetical protein HY366_00955 [Candidatus Aenigmarchaeota archaeon]|nr:hypothetical protein [Candidatus Aenigmarchaeota archaeon]
MRDLVLYAHIIIGALLILLPMWIIIEMKRPSSLVKPLATVTAVLSWLELVPAGILYLVFYPATKTLIKAGSWPWAHSIIMETKEHWGLFLPVIATTAAWLVLAGKNEESKKWWVLLAALALMIGIFGRVVKMGAGA